MAGKQLKKNSGKAPSIQFYYKDWLEDQKLKRASKKAKGVWMDLIANSCGMPVPGVFADGNDGKTPLKRREINALLTGNRRENREGIAELIRRGILKQRNDGAFYVKRVYEDMRLRRIRQEAGRKGGNPNLVNQNTNQVPTPSTSTSSSTSNIRSSCLNNVTPNSKKQAITTTTTEIISAWQKLPLPPDKKEIEGSALLAIERVISELDSNTKEPVHHGMILEAIGNYDKALRLPDSQAFKENLYNWLTKRVRKYVGYAFELENYSSSNFKGADNDTRTRLFPIPGRTCGKAKCRMPAVYKTAGDYDNYYCWEHIPPNVKADVEKTYRV